MIRLLLLGSAMIFSFTAFAASGASGDELPPLSLWSGEGYVLPVGTLLVNFTLFVGIIFFLVRKRIARLLADRADRFQALIDAAKIAEAKAKERQAELESRLAGLEGELQDVRDRFAAQLQSEEDAVRRRTAKEIERLTQSASAQVEQEAASAAAQLRHETAALALQLAAAKVRESANAEDHDRLTAGFVSDLEASP